MSATRLHGGIDKVLAVIGHLHGPHPVVDIGHAHVADGSLGLAHRLYDGTRRGHGEHARHVVLLPQHAGLEELISTRGSLAGIDHYLQVGSPLARVGIFHLIPVGHLAAEDGLQLLAGEMSDRIGGVHDDGQRIIGHHGLLQLLAAVLELHPLVELDGAGGHGDVGGAVHQGGNAHARATTSHRHATVGMERHIHLGSLLADRQHGVAALDFLSRHAGNENRRDGRQQESFRFHLLYLNI